MSEYKIKVTETLSCVVIITAESEQDAIDDVQNDYANESIVLDYNDYDDVKFEVE